MKDNSSWNLNQTRMAIQFVDRYDVLGIPRPDSETMCRGQCEGTGIVPVHKDDPNDEEGDWHTLWLVAEAKCPTDDDYHFVTCPSCGGSGKHIESRTA